jgi:predicted ribosomally synthesized peptide with SipW-like signal peptide
MQCARLFGLFVLVALVAAGGAFASFTSTVTAPQSLASATLAAPVGPAVANGACASNKSIQVNVSWVATPSAFADGYDVRRSASAAGPFSSVGIVVGVGTTSFTDSSVSFGTTYYYEIEAKKNAWRSADTPVVSVTTLSRSCK